jgi:flagellar export protein FliJ
MKTMRHSRSRDVRRFHFRLERVLRLKQQRQHLAELRLQQARLTLDAAQARVRALEVQLALAAEVVREQMTMGPTSSGAWLAANAHTAHLSRSIQDAVAKVEKAEQDMQVAAAIRVQRAVEAEALLHLRDNAWEEHREESMAGEQRRLDEEGLRRWQAHRGQGPSAEPTPGGE